MASWGRIGLVLGVLGLGLLSLLPLIPSVSPALILVIAITGLALAGASLGLLVQAYTLPGISTAPPEHFGSAVATLTLTRQLGGSIGAAAFGWLLITMSQSPHALTAVLATSAFLLVAGLVIAPRRRDEDEPAA